MSLPKLACNCPDYTGKSPGNPSAQSLSNQGDRQWVGGMKERGLYCKHIIRVIIELGLENEWGIPTDVRSPGSHRPSTRDIGARLQKRRRLGDDFS
jgi:hypothetical protein